MKKADEAAFRQGFVPANGTAFVAAPGRSHATGCVCCGEANVPTDVRRFLCRDCWRAWRFGATGVEK